MHLVISVIIGTLANNTKQNGSRQQQNFGSEGCGFESLQTRGFSQFVALKIYVDSRERKMWRIRSPLVAYHTGGDETSGYLQVYALRFGLIVRQLFSGLKDGR